MYPQKIQRINTSPKFSMKLSLETTIVAISELFNFRNLQQNFS